MAIGEIFLAAFITVLFEKLASNDFKKLVRSVKIDSELEELSRSLALIRALLVDAGEKRIKNTSVQNWLNQLQHLAYELDDILDDLATEASRGQLKQESYASTSKNKSKILKFIPTKLNAIKYGRKMSSKIDVITTKLNDLVNKKQLLGLNENVERPKQASRVRTEETSLLPIGGVIGRGGDKEALLGKLLGSESSSSQTQNFNVVSIVGQGGIGKTTLAQLVYNDEKVKEHFEFMAWVCVSDDFDVFHISKAIFQAVGGGNEDFASLNLLHEALSKKLSKKMFLLVLDDVWNTNDQEWDRLRRPFNEGAPGSKVLATTRNEMVASAMDSVESYSLDLLSNVEALSLFAQHATHEQNFDDVNPKLKLYGDEIVKKCGSLPLALRTLGRAFKGKSDEEWAELLNSEIWDSENKNVILPALMLSYYDLPPQLKQMFAYCCLFPKDYMFDKDELVLLWMGEGFLYESKSKSMEKFGQECFDELVSRLFFMQSVNDKSRYTMHDKIHDLAMNVAGEFFCMLDDKMDLNRQKVPENFHHLSFICEQYETYKRFKTLHRVRHVRTFLAMSIRWYYESYISNEFLIELLPQLQSIRVLSLAYYTITHVPEFIGRLKHLRYLNFSNTRITCLPEQVGDLHNLQSLLLSGCHNLSSLPKSIVKLINLQHLDISNTPKLNKTISGIGGLKGLQTVSKVVIGKADEFNICDLKGLFHLQGELSIKGLQNVKNPIHAREANLQQKKNICDLKIEWSDVFDDSRNERTEQEVLEALRPFEKLRSLEIMYYGGKQFPCWVGDSSFSDLTQLILHGCKSCICLPALGHLPSLQKLCVQNMDGLEKLGHELLGCFSSCHAVAFPSLKVLEFIYMKSWKEWTTVGGEIAQAFPCLREIHMINCEKLDAVAIMLIPSLEDLWVKGCSSVVLETMVRVSSPIVRLIINNIRGLTQLCKEVLMHLKDGGCLDICSCDELTYLWESGESTQEILLSLQHLTVSECINLVSLGEKKGQSIKKVEIYSCKRLESYKCPSSIERLEINSCDSLASLSFPTMDGLPSTLKHLDISDCDKVDLSWLDNNFLSSLEYLNILSNPNLKLFPEGCLLHLTSLTISGCDNVESIPDNGYGFLPFHCLRELYISDCKNLKSFPHEHLQTLASLEEMGIQDCPNLDYSFPCGLWPPNLSSLAIGDLKKPISEWGIQNFPTSLVNLTLFSYEDEGVVSFAKAEEGTTSTSSFLLPSSLTRLRILGFKELESLSEGLQHLTCLQHLNIFNCEKLRDLPETLVPSLLSLTVSCCSLKLRKKCSRKGKYWPIISQIPDLDIE